MGGSLPPRIGLPFLHLRPLKMACGFLSPRAFPAPSLTGREGDSQGLGATLSRCLWQESFATFSPVADLCPTHHVTTQECDLEPPLA